MPGGRTWSSLSIQIQLYPILHIMLSCNSFLKKYEYLKQTHSWELETWRASACLQTVLSVQMFSATHNPSVMLESVLPQAEGLGLGFHEKWVIAERVRCKWLRLVLSVGCLGSPLETDICVPVEAFNQDPCWHLLWDPQDLNSIPYGLESFLGFPRMT